MSLAVKDAAGSSINLATGSGDGAGTPFKSPAAVGIGDVADAAVTNPASSASVIAALKGLLTQGGAAVPAGTNLIGKVSTDQTSHGTSDLVAADITKVAGAAVATGHGLAAGSVRVELPTDGTGVVGLNAGANLIGKVGIDQTTPGTTNAVYVSTSAYTSVVDVTRPADTAAYAAGDVIGTTTSAGGAILTFSSAGPSAAHLLVSDADLRYDVGSVPSGMTSFRLHLYDTSPTSSNLGDNAVWTLASGDKGSYLGYLDLGTPAAAGVSGAASLYSLNAALNTLIKLSGGTTLYGYLVTAGAFTPTSGATLRVRFRGMGV